MLHTGRNWSRFNSGRRFPMKASGDKVAPKAGIVLPGHRPQPDGSVLIMVQAPSEDEFDRPLKDLKRMVVLTAPMETPESESPFEAVIDRPWLRDDCVAGKVENIRVDLDQVMTPSDVGQTFQVRIPPHDTPYFDTRVICSD